MVVEMVGQKVGQMVGQKLASHFRIFASWSLKLELEPVEIQIQVSSFEMNVSRENKVRNWLNKIIKKTRKYLMYALVFMLWIDRSREMLSNGVKIVSNGANFTSFWPLQSFEHFQSDSSLKIIINDWPYYTCLCKTLKWSKRCEICSVWDDFYTIRKHFARSVDSDHKN